MTLYQTFQEVSLVFCALQDDRHHAVADESPDRRRVARRDLAGHAICVAWPQAHDCFGNATRDLRIYAACKPAALSAGIAISAMGCRARRARWHCRARRIDRR